MLFGAWIHFLLAMVVAAAPPPRIANAGSLPRLVFVSRQQAPPGSGQIPGFGPHGRALATGGTLLVRERNGRVHALLGSSNLFDVSDPCVSWDGRQVLFAATTSAEAPWRIWVVNSDGTGLAPVTTSDRNVDLASGGFDAARFERYDDLDPCWLPDGRICFASTRWPQRGQFDASPVTNLYLTQLDPAGTPRRTTAERNGGEEPSIDPATGRVVYSRWWFNRFLPSDEGLHGIVVERAQAVPQDTVNQWTAASVTPDGDGVKLAGGDARVRRGLAAYEPVVLLDGTLVAVSAEASPLAPQPGRLQIRIFPGGLSAPRVLVGSGTALPGSACAPAALPDGRLAFSWAAEGSEDFGLYAVRPERIRGRTGKDRASTGKDPSRPYQDRFERILDLLGTLELDVAVLAPQKRPPVIPDEFPDAPALLPNTRLGQVTDVATTTFRFDCLNVFTNAAVDAAIPDAPALEQGLRIRFFSVVARPDEAGGDSLVFLREVPIDASGAIHVDDILADAPAFEQLVDAQGRVVRSVRGPAHVPGFNFARLGAGTKCVGCHTGHSTIPVPPNNWRAKWFNAAPSAEVWASSSSIGAPRAAVDRRALGSASEVAWVAQTASGEKIRLTWKTPIEVRSVVLYSVHTDPTDGTNQRIRETEISFLRDGTEVKRLTVRRDLSPRGTRIDCEPVRVDAIEIAPTRVSGLVQRRAATALAEIEAIARLLED